MQKSSCFTPICIESCIDMICRLAPPVLTNGRNNVKPEKRAPSPPSEEEQLTPPKARQRTKVTIKVKPSTDPSVHSSDEGVPLQEPPPSKSFERTHKEPKVKPKKTEDKTNRPLKV